MSGKGKDRAKDRKAEDATAEPPKSALRENFESIVVAVLFALFVRTFIAQPYKIPSGSMEDTLLVGDHLVVDKVGYGDGADRDGLSLLPTRPIRRGDVVIFRPPINDREDYIKRVIGLPGERIGLTYSPERNGVRVHVDGKPLPENYRLSHFGEVHEEPGAQWTVTFTGEPPEPRNGWLATEHVLGPGQYFVMGDNRNNSEDARFWPVHHVDAERIRGRAMFIYWSYDVGRDDPEPKGLLARVGHYAKIALTFVTRSRWSRTFHPIE